MKMTDLERAYRHFERHKEVGYLKLTMVHKIALSLVFFVLIPTAISNLFFIAKRKKKETFILEYTDTQPYKTIYKQLREIRELTFISLPRWYIPIVPKIFLRDVLDTFTTNPSFIFYNLPFLGALALKISKYHFLIREQGISKLIVLQEYSFYSSYLTRMLEYEKGALYNIQHGIPGVTYCFFRFTKCFVWGEHYKQEYIKNSAEKTQFLIAGSIFHWALKNTKEVKNDIDILYVMQGYAGGKEDTLDILNVLNKFVDQYTVRVLQHPRHKITIDNNLKEFNGDVIEAIGRSKVILSRYSTSLLDAQYLNKYTLAYVGNNQKIEAYVTYLDTEQVIKDLDTLYIKLQDALKEEFQSYLDKSYIDREINPLKVIRDECT